MRARASASATREVSIVIQRRPHCSATVGGGAGTAGRVEHEVAGVGGHQDAAFNNLRVQFERRKSSFAETADADVVPDVRDRDDWEVVEIAHVAKRLADCDEPICLAQALAFPARFVFQCPLRRT